MCRTVNIGSGASTATLDSAPSLAVILFCAARYEIYAVRWLSARPIIRLGEASYSIYLTHMLVFLIVAGSQDAIPASLATYCYLVARLVAIVVFIFFLSNSLFVWIEDPRTSRVARDLVEIDIAPYADANNIRRPDPAVVVIALNVIVIAHSRSSVLSSGVQVESATYGANCGATTGNVSLRLQAACQGRSLCDYVVDVQKLGDPASGCEKDFAVNFTCAPHRELFHLYVPGEAGLGTPVQLNCDK